MSKGGAALKFGQTGLRVVQLLSAIIILGIFSYYLASLSHHHLPIRQWIRAVEGISGAACLYGFFGVFLTLCLGGVSFFALLAIIIDICFIGCYVAIAYLTRGGAGTCNGYVNTPLGSGPSNSSAAGYGENGFGFGLNYTEGYSPNLHRACKLETASFSLALLMVFFFFFSAAMQFLLMRHHRQEKAAGVTHHHGISSAAGMTGGSRLKFWKRNPKVQNTRDAEMATAATAGRRSHESGYTGTTMEGAMGEPKYGQAGYGQETGTVTRH